MSTDSAELLTRARRMLSEVYFPGRDEPYETINALIKALEAASPIEAPGRDMVMVPREPTEAMIARGGGAADDRYWKWRGLGERKPGEGLDGMHTFIDAAYRAMIDAFLKGAPDAGK